MKNRSIRWIQAWIITTSVPRHMKSWEMTSREQLPQSLQRTQYLILKYLKFIKFEVQSIFLSDSVIKKSYMKVKYTIFIYSVLHLKPWSFKNTSFKKNPKGLVKTPWLQVWLSNCKNEDSVWSCNNYPSDYFDSLKKKKWKIGHPCFSSTLFTKNSYIFSNSAN